MNKSILIISLLGVFLSSTFFHNFFLTTTTVIALDNTNKKQEESSLDEIFPLVYHYHSIKKSYIQKKNMNFKFYNYSFNMLNLDSKPSYYENKLLPESWTKTKLMQMNHKFLTWSIVQYKNHLKTALVAVSYSISDVNVNNKNELKLLRLKMALSGKNKTQLRWLGVVCKTDCIKENLVLLKILENN